MTSKHPAQVRVYATTDPPGLVSPDDDDFGVDDSAAPGPSGSPTAPPEPSAAPSATPGPSASFDPSPAPSSAATTSADGLRRGLSTEAVDYAEAFNADEANGETFCAAVARSAPSASGVEACLAEAASATNVANHRVRIGYTVVFDTFALDDVDAFVNATLTAVKSEVADAMRTGAFEDFLAAEAAFRNASNATVLDLSVDTARSVDAVEALDVADVAVSVATFLPTHAPTQLPEKKKKPDMLMLYLAAAVGVLFLLACCCGTLAQYMTTGKRRYAVQDSMADRRERGMIARMITVQPSDGGPPRPEDLPPVPPPGDWALSAKVAPLALPPGRP